MTNDAQRAWNNDEAIRRREGIRVGRIEPIHGGREGVAAGCGCTPCEEARRRRAPKVRPRRHLTPSERAALIRELDPTCWAEFADRLIDDGCTQVEIGRAVGITAGAVRLRLRQHRPNSGNERGT